MRVKWLLHELLGDDFDVEVVSLYDCAQHSPEYLEKNPNHNVPTLEITLDNGEQMVMLESGAMVSLLADLFPEKALAPAPDVFSVERANYLQMLHFTSTSMDMMLWQIRVHTHLLGTEKDEKTIVRYRDKFTEKSNPNYWRGWVSMIIYAVLSLAPLTASWGQTSRGRGPMTCVRTACLLNI